MIGGGAAGEDDGAPAVTFSSAPLQDGREDRAESHKRVSDRDLRSKSTEFSGLGLRWM